MRTLYIRDRVYNYDHCIAGGPRNGGGFLHPSDFAIGSGDTVYLLSKGIDYIPAMGITKCALDGEFFWHERGPAFSERVGPLPSSVAVDSQENVYVSDEYTNRIGVYAPDGTHLGEWGAPPAEDRIMPGLSLNIWSMTFNPYLKKVGSIDTSGDGDLNGPAGLAFDRDDRLYVSDSHNHRVQIFTKDGSFLGKWGSHGNGDGEFNWPWGLAFDNEGNVLVADWGNCRVQKFSPDGKFLDVIVAAGEEKLGRPSDVAVDKDGDVYVTDWENNRLNVYDGEYDYMFSLYGDADDISPWVENALKSRPDLVKALRRADSPRVKKFKRPVAVNVDAAGRIIVLESAAYRFQIYVKEQNWVEPPFNL